MNKFLGVVLVIAGLALGLYLGVWVLFAGGILGLVDVVNGMIEGNGVDGMLVVWSILKIGLASFCGTLAAYAGIVPGIVIFNKD